MTTKAVPFVDTHCHLTDYDDPLGVLGAAIDAAVHVVAVTRTPTEYRTLRTRLGRRAGVTVALGMHPQHRQSTSREALVRFYRLASEAPFLGEVGIDHSDASPADRRAQRHVFEAVCAHVAAHPVPVTVHSRGAAKDVTDTLRAAGITAILHWFTGPLAIAEAAIADGHAFSINPAIPRSKRGPALLALLPHDRVLLETDGPFVRLGRRSATPADVHSVVINLAKAWNADLRDVHAQLIANQQRVLTPALDQSHTANENF